MKTTDMYGHVFLGDIVEVKNYPGKYAIVTRITPNSRTAPFRLTYIHRSKTGKLVIEKVPFNVVYKFMVEETRTLSDGEKQLFIAELALNGIYYTDVMGTTK